MGRRSCVTFTVFRTAIPCRTRSARRRLHPNEIDIVINTHLHFDHCGGNTRSRKADKIVRRFPTRNTSCSAAEYEHAMQSQRARPRQLFSKTFRADDKSGPKWQLLEGDRDIAPGVRVVRIPGHTANMQCVKTHRRRQDRGILLADLRSHRRAPAAAVDHGLRPVSA